MAVVAIVTAVFLGLVLKDLDLSAARASIAAFEAWTLLPMAGLYVLAHGLRSVRLSLLLKDEGTPDVPLLRLFVVNGVGFLAINLIPLRLGEMVRPWLLAERYGVPFGRGLAAILLERMLDFVVLLGMLLGLGLVVDLPAEGLEVAGVDVIHTAQRALGVLLLVGIVGGGVAVALGDQAAALLRRLPLGEPISRFALQFRGAFVALLKRPGRALGAASASVGIVAATVAAVAVVMSGFEGIPASLVTAFATWTITLSGMVAVPTPGFFGPYELFCTAALWLWRVDPQVARAFAITLHLGQFGFTLLLGGASLAAEGLGLRDLVRPAPSSRGS